MNKGVYTVVAFKGDLDYCGCTIDDVIAFISEALKPMGYEYILHDRTEGKKPHYHIDFGWSKSLPELTDFLDACDKCNLKYRKRALTPSPDKPCDYYTPLTVVDYKNPKNGKSARDIHVVKGIKGRHKYLLHISDSAKEKGKEEYKEEKLICSIDWDEDKFKMNPATIRNQKAIEKREHDEEVHGDPLVYVYMLIAELNICNLPQLLNLIINSPEHRWCLAYVKNDLLKYNAIIRDFSAIHKKEYAEATMRSSKSNNTECCQNVQFMQDIQMGLVEADELDFDPFNNPFTDNPYSEEHDEPSDKAMQSLADEFIEGDYVDIEELPPIEFTDDLFKD